MITDKESLNEYLEADRIALKIKAEKPSIFGHEIWKYVIFQTQNENNPLF